MESPRRWQADKASEKEKSMVVESVTGGEDLGKGENGLACGPLCTSRLVVGEDREENWTSRCQLPRACLMERPTYHWKWRRKGWARDIPVHARERVRPHTLSPTVVVFISLKKCVDMSTKSAKTKLRKMTKSWGLLIKNHRLISQ